MSSQIAPWEDFPDYALSGLAAKTSLMSTDDALLLQQTWERLRPLCVASWGAGDGNLRVLDVNGAKDVLLKYFSKLVSSKVNEDLLKPDVERAKALLELVCGSSIPTIVIRKFPRPLQSLPAKVSADVRAATRVAVQLDRLLVGEIEDSRAPLSHPAKVGLLALLLIFDNGVLSRPELNAAIDAIFQPPAIRACRGSYYIWLPNIKGRKASHFGARRLFMTPRTVAAALSIDPGETRCDLDDAIRSICKAMGLPRSETPSLTALMQGVATTLRLTAKVPQFVVDYAQARIVSHAVPESTWRRLIGLAPWSEAKPPESVAPDTDAPEARTQDEAAPRFESRGYLTDARSILRMTEKPSVAIESLLSLKASRAPVSEIDEILLEWIIHLLGEKIPRGSTRRIGTIRTMVNALAPRLMAELVETPIASLSEDDWQLALEHMIDSDLSGSWNATIQKSLAHFVAWAHAKGHLKLVPSLKGAEHKEGLVHATLITPEEFDRLTEQLEDAASAEPRNERDFQELIARFAFAYAFRRGEAWGLNNSEFNFDRGTTVDVVNNENRPLKTESSQRRIPVALNDHHGIDDDIREHIMEGAPESRTAGRLNVAAAEETLLRRLSEKLSRVTGDDDVSIHTLRHSAATWLLLTLYAEDLDLSRFMQDWPFTSSLIARCSRTQEILLGRRGSMHRLHAVRQLLGHRHEEMTLLHYIHALDWLRYAAATLGRPETAERVSAVYKIANGKPLRSKSLGAALVRIEQEFGARILRDDTARKVVAPGHNPQATKSEGLLRTWQLTSNRIRDLDSDIPRNMYETHANLVETVNQKKVANGRSGAGSTIKSLAEIVPRSAAELDLCSRISKWAEQYGAAEEQISQTAKELLSAFDTKGLGRFSLSIEKAEPVLGVLKPLSGLAFLNFELSIERRTLSEEGKDRRIETTITSVSIARANQATRIFIRPRYALASEGRKKFPLRAFVWVLTMLVLCRTEGNATAPTT